MNTERLGDAKWCLTLSRSLLDLLANFNPSFGQPILIPLCV
jgi:hypothetical protein